jgi:putative MFS transporter
MAEEALLETNKRQALELFARLDNSRFSRRHAVLYAGVVALHFFDGFDLLMIGAILPDLRNAFQLTSGQAGALASSVFVGMLVGALAITRLADIIGRKRALLVSVAVYTAMSLAAAIAPNFETLLVIRIVAGLGLGAEVPLVFTYLLEFLPVRRRGIYTSASVFFWQISGGLAALLAMVIVPAFSWRGMFVVGAAPAMILLFAWHYLPESVRFLVRKGRMDEAEKIVDHLSSVKSYPATFRAVTQNQSAKKIGDIFRGRYARYTAGAWVLNFSFGMIFTGLNVWLPSIFLRMGFLIAHSLVFTAVITGAGAVGNLCNGFLLERIGRRMTLGLLCFIGAICVLAWGYASNPVAILILGAATAFTAGGGIGGSIYTYISELYPTNYRATGAGYATACNRMGGIVAPFVLGILLGSEVPLFTSFAFVSGLMTLAGISAFTLVYETRGKSLEEIELALSPFREEFSKSPEVGRLMSESFVDR